MSVDFGALEASDREVPLSGGLSNHSARSAV
jgi:hypothetical protein